MAKATEIGGIDCAAEALESAVRILSARFKEVADLRESALDFSDIEGVHDMRVAVRRLRSALRDFAPLFDKSALKTVKKDLKRIFDTLGDVRDQDVALDMLTKFALKTESETLKNGVGALTEKRAKRRAKARSELEKTITVENISELESKFSEALENAVERRKSAPEISFGDYGNKIIKSSWQNLQDLGASLYAPFDIEKLHEMRIAAKRLRYAVELFAVCKDESFKYFADQIAEMQSFLGDVHDCDVWIEDLRLVLKSEHKKQTHDTERQQAAIRPLLEFTKKRTKKYRAALKLWNNWQGNFFAQILKAAIL